MTNDPNPNDETNARQRVGSRTPGLGFVILHSDLVIHSGIRGFGDFENAASAHLGSQTGDTCRRVAITGILPSCRNFLEFYSSGVRKSFETLLLR